MAEHSPTEGQQRAPGGAQVSIRIGTAVEFEAHVSTIGLLAAGVLMSGILLGSATIVLAANRNKGRSIPNLPESGVEAR